MVALTSAGSFDCGHAVLAGKNARELLRAFSAQDDRELCFLSYVDAML